MLARLNADTRTQVSYLSRPGTSLLVVGAAEASLADVLAACRAGLTDTGFEPSVRPAADAQSAWSAREGGEWLAYEELWELSWSEAETFAERVLRVLVAEHGDDARGLRPVLVESFFAGVRPAGPLGPAPTRWERGASQAVRLAVILAEAERILGGERTRAVRALLEDTQRLDAILNPETQPLLRVGLPQSE